MQYSLSFLGKKTKHSQPFCLLCTPCVAGQVQAALRSLYLSVHRVQLVGHVPVILAGHALTDSRFHQPGQGREHVDRGEDFLRVQLPVEVDLDKNAPQQTARTEEPKIGNKYQVRVMLDGC